jgi:hypothetical protein
MKASIIFVSIAVAGLTALGVIMAKTNPNQQGYENYAVQRLTKYFKDDICRKTPQFLENLVHFNCNKLVDSANPHIREIITGTTERRNYIFFSIYHTEVKIDPALPGYKLDTLGIFDNFYTYTSEKA